MKRRRLQPGQKVVLIYKHPIGFVEEYTEFIDYKTEIINNISHEVPFFKNKETTISGLECFWILPSDLVGRHTIKRYQREVIWLQFKVLELSAQLGINMPNKLQNKKIEMAADYTNKLVQKLGFDPRDESWIETELAITDREKKWFEFERTKGVVFYRLLYSSSWDDIVRIFNEEFKDSITLEQAKKLSLKRMRYIMGSNPIRMSGAKDKEKWKKAAREFEEEHRAIEERMVTWSESRKGNFPLVKTKTTLDFSSGPYLNQCLDNIPEMFTDLKCNKLQAGIMLRVISFDPETRYIRLDFTQEIRSKIKPTSDKPWISEGADYIIWLDREHIFTALEFLGESL